MQHKLAIAVILFWLWSCLAFAAPSSQKPAIWACDPGTVAYNCARLGLPMPVIAMPFWEGSGTVYDYSGGGESGTLEDGALWKPGGVYCDGTNDYVQTAWSPGVDRGTIFITMTAHFCSNSDKVWSAYTGGHHFDLMMYSGKWNFWGEGFDIYSATPAIVVGKRVTVTCTWDAVTGAKVYGDGVFYEGDGTISQQVTTSLRIGSKTTGADFAEMTVENLYGFAVALSADQVQTLHANPYGMFKPISMVWYMPVAGGLAIKSINSILWEDVKSVNSVAKASIKSINGIE